MILVDFSQIMVATWAVTMLQMRKQPSYEEMFPNSDRGKVSIGLVRHMALNSLRANRVKFKKKYGELVIACDANSWRKQVFPHYKANRKKDSDSGIDWAAFYEACNLVIAELDQHFQYPVVRFQSAEADDVIATLAEKYHTLEPILILSSDKDFSQLQKFSGVEQYNPVQNKMIECTNPELFLKEHIIRGDSGDGIPNFLSQDDSFVNKVRQKAILSKNLGNWLLQEPEQFCNEETLPRYRRNERLIDFSFIPEEVKTGIIDTYRSQLGKERSGLFEYFARSGLRDLTQHAGDF